MPHAAPPRTSALTRRAALVSGVALLSGCSVRLERGSALPGPKATLPSDVAPLQQVHGRLLDVVAAADAAGAHPPQAAGALGLHRRQLVRLDATLEGLGAPRPSASSSGSSGTARAWPSAEADWISAASLHDFTTISHVSRPLAMCIAASGLAAADGAGSPAPFAPTGTFPAVTATAALHAAQAAIEALEWIAAREDATKRGTIPAALEWLTAARATIEAAAPFAPAGSRATVRTYTDADAAKKVAVTALQDLTSACARAARSATTPEDVTGVLYVWSKTLRELARLGAPDTTVLPGLTA